MESVGKNAVHEVEALGKKSINELESEFKKVTHEIEDVAEKAIDELEAETKAVLNAIFAELTSQGFQKALKVLEKAERIGETALKDASFSVDISAIGFSWGNNLADVSARYAVRLRSWQRKRRNCRVPIS